jgi:hypothetical protein
MLQSKAGVENREYKAQRSLLADVDAGRISRDDFFAHAEELLRERLPKPAGAHPAPPKPAPAPAVQRPAGPPPAAAPATGNAPSGPLPN